MVRAIYPNLFSSAMKFKRDKRNDVTAFFENSCAFLPDLSLSQHFI
jgi:hypothetical protein